MEEKIKVRPCTPRTVEKKAEDTLEIQDPSHELARITGLNPLVFAKLLKLELKVDSEDVALHNFGNLCPCLKELKLSGSSIESIRTLGTHWPNLEIL